MSAKLPKFVTIKSKQAPTSNADQQEFDQKVSVRPLYKDL